MRRCEFVLVWVVRQLLGLGIREDMKGAACSGGVSEHRSAYAIQEALLHHTRFGGRRHDAPAS